MVNLQELLDREYPTQKEKEQVKEIVVRSNENMLPHFYTSLPLTQEQVKETDGGELTIQDYPNLKKVWIAEGLEGENLLKTKLTKLDIINCSNLAWIKCWENELTNLDLSKQTSLTWLNCWSNQLANLNLEGCVNLTSLDCQLNQLTDLEFLNGLSGEKLESLNVQNNIFFSDLTPLSKFINLKQLWLGNWDQARIEKGIYNRFIGSLEPLQKMSKLEVLSIDNTDLSSGLEYLPENIEHFWCSAKQRPQATCQIFQKLLAPYKDRHGSHYNCQAWKQANPELVNNAQQIIELEKTLGNLNLALVNGKVENETISKVLDVFQFETEEKIREMRKQNQEYYQAQIVHNPPKTS